MNQQAHPRSSRGLPSEAVELGPRTLGDEIIDFKRIAETLWREKKLVGGAALIAAVLGFLAISQVQPTYSTQAQVMLETRARQVIGIENILRDAQFGLSGAQSETVVLQSPEVLRLVAERLRLADLPEFNPSLQTPGLLSRVVGGIAGAIFRRGASEGGGGPARTPAETAAAILSGQLTISQFGDTYVLQIGVESSNPQRAADIANEIAAVYLEQQVEFKLAAAETATRWLASRADELRERVEQAELAVARARASLNAEGEVSETVIERQMPELSTRLVQIRIEYARAEGLYSQFVALIEQGNYAAAVALASSPQLDRLIARREELVQQAEAIRRRFGDQGPESNGVAEALEAANQSIVQNATEVATSLRANADILRDQIRIVERQILELEQTVTDQSTRQIDLRALEREAEAQRAVYGAFLTRLMEARERGGFQEPDARIIAPALVPTRPSAPRKGPVVVMAALLGMAVGSGVALWREGRRQAMRSASDIAAATGLRTLGFLPAFPGGRLRGAALRRALASPPEEVWRVVRRMVGTLRAAAPQDGPLVAMVGSALPGDGATAVGVLLARALAAEGARTALLDCDPVAGTFLKSLQAGGSAPSALVDLGVDLLPPPQPAAGGGFVQGVLDAVAAARRAGYDAVVLDTAPVLASADARLAAGAAHAVLLAVRWGETPRGALVSAVEELREAEAPILGVVSTFVDPDEAALRAYAGAPSVRARLAGYRRRR
jgi:uncharacterized protein involved in exopolysaccharide biosynthesis/Mrp family chromosome partitioning ATPase